MKATLIFKNNKIYTRAGVANGGRWKSHSTSPFAATASATKGSQEELLNLYGTKRQNGVSLKNLIKVSTGETLVNFSSSDGLFSSIPRDHRAAIVTQIGCFLHRELPIRYAHRVLEIEKDEFLMRSPSIQMIHKCYKDTFSDFLNTPIPSSPEKQALFDDIAQRKKQRNSFTLVCMSRGAYELRQIMAKEGSTLEQERRLHAAFDDMYHSRIALRLLLGHYMAMKAAVESPSDENIVGLLNLQCSTKDTIMKAADHASAISQMTYGASPKVEIAGRTDLTFPYIQSHLMYMLFELLKNSMRATVETHGTDDMPPIRVVIADREDNEDVVIKVSDEGGGIKRSNMDRIWSCLFSTGNPSAIESIMHPYTDLSHYPLRNAVNASANGGGSASGREYVDQSYDLVCQIDGTSTGGLTDLTAVQDPLNQPINGDESLYVTNITAPMAGLGYGLPLARSYARFFGGDLVMESMEGYGTDSYLYLPRLSKDTTTVL